MALDIATLPELSRRELLLWLVAGSIAVAAELQGPALRKSPKLPACEPLSKNPFPPGFLDVGFFDVSFIDAPVGPERGMQCGNPDVPPSPKIVIRVTPPSVAIVPGISK
jgi:hypothetical protein